jgi:hypothetical protein
LPFRKTAAPAGDVVISRIPGFGTTVATLDSFRLETAENQNAGERTGAPRFWPSLDRGKDALPSRGGMRRGRGFQRLRRGLYRAHFVRGLGFGFADRNGRSLQTSAGTFRRGVELGIIAVWPGDLLQTV